MRDLVDLVWMNPKLDKYLAQHLERERLRRGEGEFALANMRVMYADAWGPPPAPPAETEEKRTDAAMTHGARWERIRRKLETKHKNGDPY